MACEMLHKDCSKLPFDKYRPSCKPDDDGDVEVICEEFKRKVEK